MRHAGQPGWLMRVESSPQGLLLGLFVRDAAGMQPPTVIDLPRLDPVVELRAVLAPLAVTAASEQWAGWWEREMARQEGHDRGFFAPDARFGDGEELDALVEACRDDAARWASDIGREALDANLRAGPRGVEGDVVDQVEAGLGRKARPFDLLITELPLAGALGWRVSTHHVLVTRALRADRAGYSRWLSPVVRELA
jgi:hypothetical protein